MPEKDGDEGKSTKSVVNKKQKQMMGEEGYDIARDMGKVRPSKDKKDATTLRNPPSKEMKKTQKVNKGPSAFERVKARYGKSVMKVEELDLTQVAEAFGGYIVEQENPPIDITSKNQRQILKRLQQGKPLSGINNKNDKDDLDTSQGVKDELGSNLGNKAKQDAAKDALLDAINKPPRRTKPDITGGGGRNRPRITGDVETTKKRAPRKGVDYFFDPKKAKAEREKTVAKRKEYEIDPEGKTATDAGVEKFARKSLSRKQQASGSNVPIELSKSDLDTAREKLVGGKEVKDSKGNVVGTTTGKYGGRMAKQMSPKNLQKLRSKLKADGFIGDKPPEREQQKPPDRKSGNKIFDKNEIKGGERKDGKVELPRLGPLAKAKQFAKDNPIGGYAGVELGKGIIGKLMKVKGAIPGVVGGTVGRRSARGGGGL